MRHSSGIRWRACGRVLADSPNTLLPLRMVAGLGTVLSIFAMVASFAAARRELSAAWLTVGCAVVAFDRSVLDYSIEFRPDSWSTALLFVAFFLLLTGRPASTSRRSATFAGLASVAVLTSPKFFLLPLIFGVIDLIRRVRLRDDVGGALLGYLSGVGASIIAAFAFLRFTGIDPSLAWQMVVNYQWTYETHTAFRLGALESVLRHPRLLALVLLGVVAWAAYLFRTRRLPAPFEIAVLLFLLAQLVAVDRPYSSTYAPWFLLGGCFIAFIGLYVERAAKAAAPWVLGLAVLGSALVAWDARQSFAGLNQAHQMLTFYDTLLRLSAEDTRIVAYPPLHPVVRRDVFYAWSRTTDPAGSGTEAVMSAMAVPDYSDRFVRDYYRGELESNAPTLIVSPLDDGWTYEPGQWSVLRDYLAMHRAEYALIERGMLRPVWVRRDRVNRGPAGTVWRHVVDESGAARGSGAGSGLRECTMCGIAGFVGSGDTEDLARMSKALWHRGPDALRSVAGSGSGQSTLQYVVSRFSTARVPRSRCARPTAAMVVGYNGEIYNHVELRRELEAAGARFVTDHSDTEVLLHAYRQWGPALTTRLNGMWAFVIYDTRHSAGFF